ncbi:peptidoglycan recognition family protein, partial [Clostridium sp.]|uniref:peptidoglycan recognition protein family protein n=1 Tax=Clostridium sp. TaxID=1506 RepID=UPI003217C8CE
MSNITKKISNYNFSNRNGNSIKYIVMHFTGNQNDTALGNANYFGGGNRNASAHYFVDNDNIVQVVEDSNSSWNCGDGNGAYGITNQNSIAIEMCGTGGGISSATENNTIKLVKYLMDKYNVSIDRVVRHYDASRKICPAPWSKDNWAKWTEFKGKLVGNKNSIATPTPEVVPTPPPTPSKKKIDSFIKVDNFSWVKNLDDFAGWFGTPVKNLYAYPSEGEILFRVSPVNRDYYSW